MWKKHRYTVIIFVSVWFEFMLKTPKICNVTSLLTLYFSLSSTGVKSIAVRWLWKILRFGFGPMRKWRQRHCWRSGGRNLFQLQRRPWCTWHAHSPSRSLTPQQQKRGQKWQSTWITLTRRWHDETWHKSTAPQTPAWTPSPSTPQPPRSIQFWSRRRKNRHGKRWSW